MGVILPLYQNASPLCTGVTVQHVSAIRWELLVLEINYFFACEIGSQLPLLVHDFVVCDLRQSVSVDREVS